MYTAHEIRTIIRNCKTNGELQQADFLILMTEAHNYSAVLLQAFEAAIFNQRLKIKQQQTL